MRKTITGPLEGRTAGGGRPGIRGSMTIQHGESGAVLVLDHEPG